MSSYDQTQSELGEVVSLKAEDVTTVHSLNDVSAKSRMDDSQAEDYNANKKQVATTGRLKKRTIQEQRSLENAVTQELQHGHPIQAIALRLKISLDVTRKVFVKLIQGGNQEQITTPKYEVVKSGVKIKDLPFLDSTDADFFKVERHPNGVLIKPFDITENENE